MFVIFTYKLQAEADAVEKDKQLNDLLVRLSQYEQVRLWWCLYATTFNIPSRCDIGFELDF